MRHARLATRLYNAPLLITRDKAEVIEAVFRAHEEGMAASLEAYEAPTRQALAESGASRADAGYTVTQDGIAIIPALGTLVQRAGPMEAESGMTGYNQLGMQHSAAMRDPRVRGIMLEIDSPGGEVGGVFELADQIKAGTKPTFAYANEFAFSAAYALAASADKLLMPKTGMVGSVGVIMMHVDKSVADTKRGHAYTPIIAGAKKADFSSHAPLTDGARAAAQANVDRLYDIFVQQVSTHRAISPDAVRATEAGLLTPGEAMALGMADGVASFGEAMQQLAATIYAPAFESTYGLRAASTPQEPHMANEVTKEAHDAAVAAARAEGAEQAQRELGERQRAAVAEASASAVRANAERVKAILGCDDAKARPALAQHLALETELSAEQALAMLAKAGVETAPKQPDRLANAMAGIENPKVGADTGDEQSATQQEVSRIVALHNRNIGRK